MDPLKALELLNKATGQLQATREAHLLLQQAIATLNDFVVAHTQENQPDPNPVEKTKIRKKTDNPQDAPK